MDGFEGLDGSIGGALIDTFLGIDCLIGRTAEDNIADFEGSLRGPLEHLDNGKLRTALGQKLPARSCFFLR